MKTSILLLTLAMLTCSCKNTKVVGNVVYQRISFPSSAGPWQSLIVAYPVGQTNLQKIVKSDSVAGPIPSVFNSSIKSAAFIGGMYQVRDKGNDGNNIEVHNESSSSSSSKSESNSK